MSFPVISFSGATYSYGFYGYTRERPGGAHGS